MGIDVADLLRKFKWKRELDYKAISFRKLLIVIFLVSAIFLYFGPSFFRWLFGRSGSSIVGASRCLSDRVDPYVLESLEFNADVKFNPAPEDDQTLDIVHFVGNGHVGLKTSQDSPIYIKTGKVVSSQVPFHPVVSVVTDENSEGAGHLQEASVLQFTSGLGHKIQCVPLASGGTLEIAHQFYAHQVIPTLLVQSIKITNPTNHDVTVSVSRGGISKWQTSVIFTTKIKHPDGERDYLVITGTVREGSKQTVVAVVTTKVPSSVQVKARDSFTLDVLTVTTYGTLRDSNQYSSIKDNLEKDALRDMSLVASIPSWQLRDNHVEVWRQLFSTGLSISTSKAAGAINGDQINSTLYMTLSQVRSRLGQSKISQAERDNLNIHLAYTEGCYGGHHTLQAPKLWADMSSVESMHKVTSLWLRTLEAQGCHKLVRMGAEGVMQAMLLSFGALKFSNQHLEFNTEPKDLHRDFLYRRINYGNATHVNITVAVLDDNKAALFVALDRSDKDYYACDGGCLDPPVQLSQSRTQFPVKLTEPRTAVLYITSDKQHMEDLKHTIHVHEVAEAPAHEHHVIALHKHGNHLGGLPTFFWATFSLLIILFHLFLFKLIYNEYCSGVQPEIKTTRTRKFSDL